MGQCTTRDVLIEFNVWTEAHEMTAYAPDIIFIVIGGLPDTAGLQTGNDLAISAWDIISADAKPGQNVEDKDVYKKLLVCSRLE